MLDPYDPTQSPTLKNSRILLPQLPGNRSSHRATLSHPHSDSANRSQLLSI
jgi:hypothetical protein